MSHSNQKFLFPLARLSAVPDDVDRVGRAANDSRACATGRLVIKTGQLPMPEFLRPKVARILIETMAEAAI